MDVSPQLYKNYQGKASLILFMHLPPLPAPTPDYFETNRSRHII